MKPTKHKKAAWGLWQAFIVLSLLMICRSAFASDGDVITIDTLTAKNPSSFVVGSVEYQFDSGTEFEDQDGNHISYADFTVGDFVRARGQFVSGVLVASRLEMEGSDSSSSSSSSGSSSSSSSSSGAGDEHQTEVEGIVSDISSTSISVQGYTFTINDSTRIVDRDNQVIPVTGITVGAKVEIRAGASTPSIADKIELKRPTSEDAGDHEDISDEVEAVGSIEALTSSSVTVGGTEYLVSGDTRVQGDHHTPLTLADLAVGNLVSIEYVTSGDQRTARKIELEDENGEELEVTGPIGALGDNQITVRGIQAVISDSSELRAADGSTITFADLHLGAIVKLHLSKSGDTFIVQTLQVRGPNSSAEYNDDGVSERVVYRRSFGMWFVNYGTDNNHDGLTDNDAIQWGLPTDEVVPGDFDGDRQTDLVVWRPSTGYWYVRLSSTGYKGFKAVQWGLPGDKPIAADFDGDGIADFAVWRPSNGTWYVFLSSGGNRAQAIAGNPEDVLIRQWGLPNHEPMVADRDGDGRPDMIAVDKQTGMWATLLSSGGYNRDGALAGNASGGTFVQFGLSGDDYFAADFDGDGVDDTTVYRQGTWYLRFSSNNEIISVPFGLGDDTPGVIEPSDQSDDHRAELTVYRPTEGNHYVRTPLANVSVTQWGLPGSDDIPVGDYAK